MKDDPLNRLSVKRGSQLPWSKLDESDVQLILGIVDHRNKLKAELSELTNKKIAEKFDVHVRTIDKITSFQSWTHVINT